MFREVVAHCWRDGIGDEDKAACRAAFGALEAIPELVALRVGDDAGQHEGNFDFVGVFDFADSAAARRFVEHPLHRAFLATHARPCIARRAVVQHEWPTGFLIGIHHLKMPVTDVARSRDWYGEVFGFVVELEFVEDGALAGVALRHLEAHVRLALRRDAERATVLAGFDLVALAVSTLADLELALARVESLGFAHGPLLEGHQGWACDVPDPDGIVVRLYTHERHSLH